MQFLQKNYMSNWKKLPKPKKLCVLCESPIEDNQQICVISYPLSFVDQSYNVIPDFVNNERIIHYSCLNFSFPTFVDKLSVEPKQDSIKITNQKQVVQELSETLKQIGINPKISNIEDFIQKHGYKRNIDYLMNAWFSNQKELDQ